MVITELTVASARLLELDSKQYHSNMRRMLNATKILLAQGRKNLASQRKALLAGWIATCIKGRHRKPLK